MEEQARTKSNSLTLLLVEWDLWQNGRLDQIFGFFSVFVRVHQLAIGIDQARGHSRSDWSIIGLGMPFR